MNTKHTLVMALLLASSSVFANDLRPLFTCNIPRNEFTLDSRIVVYAELDLMINVNNGYQVAGPVQFKAAVARFLPSLEEYVNERDSVILDTDYKIIREKNGNLVLKRAVARGLNDTEIYAKFLPQSTRKFSQQFIYNDYWSKNKPLETKCTQVGFNGESW